MSKLHWNYFLALEEDVIELSRYIEFSNANFKTYSIELARLLMASTQEIDVLFKQICKKHGAKAANERDYRAFFNQGHYVKVHKIEVILYRYDLNLMPFAQWDSKTPEWWTANNKVKHERDTHFSDASLENVLSSVSALLIANIYFSAEFPSPDKYIPVRVFHPKGLIQSSAGGHGLQFKLP